MNSVCLTGTVNRKPKMIGQSGKAAICYLEGSVMKWDPDVREMFQESKTFEIVCFGNSLKNLKKVTAREFISIKGHVDCRENESGGNVYVNMQIVADELTVLGTLEDGGGHRQDSYPDELGGYDDGGGNDGFGHDNMDQPPSSDGGWGDIGGW